MFFLTLSSLARPSCLAALSFEWSWELKWPWCLEILQYHWQTSPGSLVFPQDTCPVAPSPLLPRPPPPVLLLLLLLGDRDHGHGHLCLSPFGLEYSIFQGSKAAPQLTLTSESQWVPISTLFVRLIHLLSSWISVLVLVNLLLSSVFCYFIPKSMHVGPLIWQALT